MISTPDYPWEKFKDPGDGPWHEVNEGPEWLELGSFKGIIFSAGASWTSGYQLGILQYLGGDPLQISSWKKYEQPLLLNNPNGAGPYGPGHCSCLPATILTDVVSCHLLIILKPGSYIMQQTRLQMVGRIVKVDVSYWSYDRICLTRDYILLDREVTQFPVDRLFQRIQLHCQRLFLAHFRVGRMIQISKSSRKRGRIFGIG